MIWNKFAIKEFTYDGSADINVDKDIFAVSNPLCIFQGN